MLYEAITFLHGGLDRKGTDHGVKNVLLIDDTLSQIHETAAFGIYRPVFFYPVTDGSEHRLVVAQLPGIELGIASAQIEGIEALGQSGVL